MQMFDNTSIDRIIKAINSGYELKPEFIASYVRWCVEQSQKPSTRKFVGGQRYYRVRVAKFNGWM